MKTKKDPPKYIFSDETYASLVELGEVIRGIRTRLMSEGYVIKDGHITAPAPAD